MGTNDWSRAMIKTIPRGNYGVVLTPFNQQGNIDEEILEKELIYCLSTRTQGLVICGSTGEFVYMSPEQCKQVLSISARIAAGKKTLVGGASATTEERVINYLNCLAELGYEYALVCPPYYFPQKNEEVLSFYKTISFKAPSAVKIVLYNIPFCAPQISLGILPELMSCENIVGLKDSSGDMLYLSKAIWSSKVIRPEFSVFCGQDAILLPSLTLGSQGDMSSLAWILDQTMSDILSCYDSGEQRRAELLQLHVVSLVEHLDKITFPENYRALAQVAGIPCGLPQRFFPNIMSLQFDKWKEDARDIIDVIKGL